MQQLRKRWLLLLVLALFVAGPIAWYKWSGPAAAGDETAVTAIVKEGTFPDALPAPREHDMRKCGPEKGPSVTGEAKVKQAKIAYAVPDSPGFEERDISAELNKA